jgi:hypothetical protein
VRLRNDTIEPDNRCVSDDVQGCFGRRGWGVVHGGLTICEQCAQ